MHLRLSKSDMAATTIGVRGSGGNTNGDAMNGENTSGANMGGMTTTIGTAIELAPGAVMDGKLTTELWQSGTWRLEVSRGARTRE